MSSFLDLPIKLADLFVYVCTLPFQGFSSLWGLLSVSIVSGILLLLAYGQISFQSKIKDTKRVIGSKILESVLFRHDLRISLLAQAKMFLGGIKYFLLAIPPLIILMVPCILILAQLETRYGSRPLKVGESVVIELKVDESKEELTKFKLQTQPGLEISPPVRISELGEVAWRVRATAPGLHHLILQKSDGATPISLDLPVDSSSNKILRAIYRSSLMQLLYPSETKLNNEWNNIQHITLSLPSTEISLLGYPMHWIIIFLIISILAGLVAGKIFKIEI